jgi:5-formyltetrahydrofolate cyclo-ligase
VKAWREAERARHLIAERATLPVERRRTARERVRAIRAAEMPELRRAGTVGFHRPFRGGIDLVGSVREPTAGRSRAALPVVVAKGRPLGFRRWRLGMALRPGVRGIPVPAAAEPVEPDRLPVPLVGLDDQGYRLGHGGGCYDRTIAALPRQPLAVGIGHAFQRMPTIRPWTHASSRHERRKRRLPYRRPRAFRERGAVKFTQERLAGSFEAALEPASGREHAGAAIGAEAFDQGRPGLEQADDLAERHVVGRPCKAKAAPDAPLRRDDTGRRQLADHLGEVIARDTELSSDLVRGEHALRIAGQPHQGAQSEIGERGQAHDRILGRRCRCA